jgi:hypothetical protein
VTRPAAAIPIRRGRLGPRTQPRLDRALAVAGTRAILYGPPEGTAEGAPIGHLYAVGDTPGEAVARASLVHSRLKRPGAEGNLSRRRPHAARYS